MKKTFLTCLSAILLVLQAFGSEIIFQSGFDTAEDFARWKKIPGWSRSENGGRNGTGAAVLSRKNFSGPLTSAVLDSLKPGILYRLTVWVKPENLKSDGSSRNYGAFCVEFVKDGKWMSGYYPLSADQTGKWHKCTLDFILKPQAEKTSLVLYLRKGFKGTLYFDDVTLEKAGDPHAAILVTAPSQLTFTGKSGELKITGCTSTQKKKHLTIHISGNGFELKKQLKESSPGEFRLQLNDLKPGELNVNMVLREEKNNKITAKSSCKLFVKNRAGLKTKFDESGNMYTDGKKFLPIGIFGGINNVHDLKKISDAGFNTILHYSSFSMTFGGNGRNRAETMRKALDVIRQHKLKLIFSLKDQYPGMRYARTQLDGVKGITSVTEYTVNKLKDHPALLGWYVSDELSRSELQSMVSLRELISRNDPDHPTVTLTFREGDFPVYANGGDVAAVDYYPIVDEKNKDLAPMQSLIKAAKLGKKPVWMVPQIFNCGVFRAKNAAEFEKFVYPAEKEIKAMIALSVIHGCKGFIFYSYSDICGTRGRKYHPENEEKQWRNTVSAVSMIKKLEPFILTDTPPETIIDNALETAAKLRSGSGKNIIIAVRKNLGKSRLPLPCGSSYTLIDGSAEFSGNNWFFTGKDADFCILREK